MTHDQSIDAAIMGWQNWLPQPMPALCGTWQTRCEWLMQVRELKKLLNTHEAETEKRLREACDNNGAKVFAKVRLADVLPIEGSGISDAEYSFALKSHLDFLVADAEHTPLFAVEFDGPMHEVDVQIQRDHIKDVLCDRFSLPLLRINSNYLRTKYRNMDMLSWFVAAWFGARWFDEEQAKGNISFDEPFSSWSMARIPGRQNSFPLWLSARARGKIQDLCLQRKVFDWVPFVYIGADAHDTYRALSYVRLNALHGVMVETAMRTQRFEIYRIRTEALENIVVCDLFERLEAVLAGREEPLALDDVRARRRELEHTLMLKWKCGSTDQD